MKWFTVKSVLAAFALLTLVAIPLSAKDTSAVKKAAPTNKKVLLVKSSSDLEKKVAAAIADSLLARGYTLDIIPLDNLDKAEPKEYAATLVFSGVVATKLFEPVSRYADELMRQKRTVILCTLYGEQWDEGPSTLDAVTSATKAIDPAVVVGNILRNFDKTVNKK
ncbi:MAG: hypothetical protein A2293_07485 [Elusimicrobia bacterium RIFOXYB2_FULL_49_7]|nr:MAG: hypothetical protein A2293_07485 [Elusimicrobia bacterium RIFOXYB2_FULL_49_7]